MSGRHGTQVNGISVELQKMAAFDKRHRVASVGQAATAKPSLNGAFAFPSSGLDSMGVLLPPL